MACLLPDQAQACLHCCSGTFRRFSVIYQSSDTMYASSLVVQTKVQNNRSIKDRAAYYFSTIHWTVFTWHFCTSRPMLFSTLIIDKVQADAVLWVTAYSSDKERSDTQSAINVHLGMQENPLSFSREQRGQHVIGISWQFSSILIYPLVLPCSQEIFVKWQQCRIHPLSISFQEAIRIVLSYNDISNHNHMIFTYCWQSLEISRLESYHHIHLTQHICHNHWQNFNSTRLPKTASMYSS